MGPCTGQTGRARSRTKRGGRYEATEERKGAATGAGSSEGRDPEVEVGVKAFEENRRSRRDGIDSYEWYLRLGEIV